MLLNPDPSLPCENVEFVKFPRLYVVLVHGDIHVHVQLFLTMVVLIVFCNVEWHLAIMCFFSFAPTSSSSWCIPESCPDVVYFS